MRGLICGIDLGTTNSSIAYLKAGKSVAIPVEEGSAIVPSVVSLDKETGNIIVGRQAKNRLVAFTDCTIQSIKRMMGKDTAVYLGDREMRPEEVASFILKYLVQNAGKIIGEEIEKVVITVPAYSSDAQRRATIRAGELAGLDVVRIVNEPTAAALMYDYVSLEKEDTGPYIMVYDLGGGTFDVSILEVKGDIKEVLASCGDTALGGDDFDDRLSGFFLRHIKEETGLDLSDDRVLKARLRYIAEKTKIQLSDMPYAEIKEVAVATVNGEPVNLNMEISRGEFEEMILDLVGSAIKKVKDALFEANLLAGDIAKIILVGGATRVPLVQRKLSEIFDQPIYHSIDPDLCVAMGASTQGGLIAGEPLDHILLDVTAHSLGVKTVDEVDTDTGDADYFSTIIRRNTRIPVRRAEVYYTTVNDQSGVEVEVYQGESLSCKDNTLIGEFYYDLRPAPEHSPITVEFAYDKEGVVHIIIDQKGYNNRKEVTLDVRKRKILDKEGVVTGKTPVNYVAEKAIRLSQEESLPQNLKTELSDLGGRYESGIKMGEDDDKIDELEEKLLDKIEEAEKRLEELE